MRASAANVTTRSTFVARTRSGVVHHGLTAGEIIVALLPSYAGLANDEERLHARAEDLTRLAAVTQAGLVQAASDEGVAVQDLDDNTLTALLADRSIPWEASANLADVPDRGLEWTLES